MTRLRHVTADLYDRAIREPRAWFIAAEKLEKAAEVLARDPQTQILTQEQINKGETPGELGNPYMMLVGFMLENLIKGLSVGKLVEENMSVSTEEIKKAIWGHKFSRLCESLIALSNEEKELLLRLEAFVEYAGRYPIPGNYAAAAPRPLPTGGSAVLGFRRGSDQAVIDELSRKLKAKR